MVRTLDQLIPRHKYSRIPAQWIPWHKYERLPFTEYSRIESSVQTPPVVSVAEKKAVKVRSDELSEEATDVLEASHPTAAMWGRIFTPQPFAYLWGDSRVFVRDFALFYHNRAGPNHSCAFSKYLDTHKE